MKYLVIILLAAGTIYFFSKNSNDANELQGYPGLLKKIETQKVSSEEVKNGVNALALFLCNDPVLQKTGGTSVEACLKKYNSYKGMCERRIFGNSTSEYTNREDVIAVAKRFRVCVGNE